MTTVTKKDDNDKQTKNPAEVTSTIGKEKIIHLSRADSNKG